MPADGPMPTSRPADVSRCESFCHSGFLVLLPSIAGRCARRSRQEFRIVEAGPAAPFVTFEEGGRVLVGAFWSARVSLRYRALARDREEGLVWFWIGCHTDYERLLKG